MTDPATGEPRFTELIDDIEGRFRAAEMHVVRQPDGLILHHDISFHGDDLRTRVLITAPDSTDAPDIEAIVRVYTALPGRYIKRFDNEMISFANRFAALGALTVTPQGAFVGTRLTLNKGRQDWPVLHPLALTAAAAAADAITGGMRRFLHKEKPQGGETRWNEADLRAAAIGLPAGSIRKCDASGLSIQFTFGAGEVEADSSALFDVSAVQPHIEVGPGLLCLLQLPHRMRDAERRYNAINLLNTSEMNSPALPPHIGAWCEGRAGDNFAYVTFLPELLHDVPGLVAVMVRWARQRAEAVGKLIAAAGGDIEIIKPAVP